MRSRRKSFPATPHVGLQEHHGEHGRGRALDNVFIERLWRSLKYELIYPGDFSDGHALASALADYFHFYNHQRPHQALGYKTPADLFPLPKRKRKTAS